MRRWILICLLGLLSTPRADAGETAWTPIPLLTGEDIVAIENTAFSERWLVGTGGFVARSSAGRTVWDPVDVGSMADFTSIHQPALGQVWIAGADGVVRRLIAGNWQGVDIPDAQTFSIFSRSSGQSWAVGRDGSIYKTLNGSTWVMSTVIAAAFNDGSGFVSGIAYAVGDAGAIYKTTGSDVWDPLNSITGENLLAIVEAGGALVVVGTGGTILRSGDAGATWDDIESGTAVTLHDVSISKQNGDWMIAVGDNGTVLRSTDGGLSWGALESPGAVTLLTVEAVTNSEYLVGGSGGVFFRTTTGGETPVETVSWGETKSRFR